jgi:hypothetical protein
MKTGILPYLLTASCCICLTTFSFGLGLPQIKLYGKHPKGSGPSEFGTTLAMNDRWLVVGEPKFDSSLPSTGALHVFDVKTGTHLRRILPVTNAANHQFGMSLAIEGRRALIGSNGTVRMHDLETGSRLLANQFSPAPAVSVAFARTVAMRHDLAAVSDMGGSGMEPQSGVVHMFNASTGQWLGQLKAPDGKTGDFFGTSIAMDGRIIAVGARYAKVGGVTTGAVYVFDASEGTFLRKMIPSDGVAGAEFGASIGLGRNLLLVGCPNAKSGQDATGAVYAYDLLSGAEGKWVGTDSAEGDAFGSNISVSGRRVLIGAPGHPSAGAWYAGAAYVFDLTSGQHVEKITAPDFNDEDYFGTAVAIHDDKMAVGAPLSDYLPSGSDAGAVYLIQDRAQPLPFRTVAAQRGLAPGVTDGKLASIDQWALNNSSDIAFRSTLTGTATRNGGIWCRFDTPGPLYLSLRKGDVFSGARVSSLGAPIFNQPNHAIYLAPLSGAGKSISVLWFDNGSSPAFQALVPGGMYPFFAGSQLGAISQVVQSSTQMSQAVTLKFAGDVMPNNDSGLLKLDNDLQELDSVREGTFASGGGFYGEFRRLCHTATHVAFTSGITAVPGTSQGLFTLEQGSIVRVAAQGEPALSGADLSTIIGETASSGGLTLFRATLQGISVNASNRETLWLQPGFGKDLELIARAGLQVPEMPNGTKWRRLVEYWGIASAAGAQVLFVADISGPGVSAANDRGVWLRMEDGGYLLLAREGDSIGDGSGARLASFQKVVAHPTGGRYAILAGLSGSPTASNQALLTGWTLQGNIPQAVYRKPLLRLRKGRLVEGMAGGYARIASMRLSRAAVEASGAGGKGLAQDINANGTLAIKVTFSDGSVELMTGFP